MREIHATAFALSRQADVPWPSTRTEAASLLVTLTASGRKGGGREDARQGGRPEAKGDLSHESMRAVPSRALGLTTLRPHTGAPTDRAFGSSSTVGTVNAPRSMAARSVVRGAAITARATVRQRSSLG